MFTPPSAKTVSLQMGLVAMGDNVECDPDDEKASFFAMCFVFSTVQNLTCFRVSCTFYAHSKACTLTCTESNHGERAVAAAPTDSVLELKKHPEWSQANLQEHRTENAMALDEVRHTI